MSEQNYANHRQYVPGYHFVLSSLVLIALLASWWNVYRALQHGFGRLEAVLIAVIVISMALIVWYMRMFPLKVQDRVIRAEEDLRHYVMTGELLDPRLTMRQITGLRFASDDEFLELAARAVEEGLSANEIKKAVRDWRADERRM